MIIDCLVLLCLIGCIWQGSSRGLLRSLLGPLCFLAATFFALAYFQLTRNVPVALGLALLGPFLLIFLANTLLGMAGVINDKGNVSVISMILGAAVTTVWWMSILVPVLMILPFFPGTEQWTRGSYACSVVQPLAEKFTSPKSLSAIGADGIGNGTATDPVDALANDPRMKEIMKDPAMIKAIEEKNYAAMVSNPKMLAMAQDPVFVRKAMAAYKQILTKPPVLQQPAKN